MLQHNITLSDIEGEELKEYLFNAPRRYLSLFWQIVANVAGKEKLKGIYQLRNRKFEIRLTAAEAIELKAKFKFYLDVYKKELEIFEHAFIHKNDLYSKVTDIDSLNSLEEVSEEEREKLRKVLALSQGMDKHHYLKQLTT